MLRRLIAITAIVTLASASAYAQRVEVSGIFGWTFSDGVAGDVGIPVGGEIYNAIDVKDSGSWGLGIGFNATDNFEVGFLWGQQLSTLAVEGTTNRDVGDFTINSYHPYLAYNAGLMDGKIRPYALIGFGATNYGSVDYTRLDGSAGTTLSTTKFSTTWGGGVKVFPSPNFGIRAGIHWTPTYITTDEEGWWCDPYWGCWVVGDAKYSHQFQINGGITVRF